VSFSVPTRVSWLCLALVLASVCQVLATAPCALGATPAPAGKAVAASFPLLFKGVEVTIASHATREDLSAKLGRILGKHTPMNDKGRLQYDVQFDPNEAPMAVVFDWDKAGRLVAVALEASSEAQNPPAKALRSWLLKDAGPGKTTRGKDSGVATTTWEHHGWRFTCRKGGDGEDSVFGFAITPLTTR
jgi:hypothetical protein